MYHAICKLFGSIRPNHNCSSSIFVMIRSMACPKEYILFYFRNCAVQPHLVQSIMRKFLSLESQCFYIFHHDILIAVHSCTVQSAFPVWNGTYSSSAILQLGWVLKDQLDHMYYEETPRLTLMSPICLQQMNLCCFTKPYFDKFNNFYNCKNKFQYIDK